jgi:hypothetical protein
MLGRLQLGKAMRISKKASAAREREAKKDRKRRLKKIDEIVRRVKALPDLSTASEDEILGYNDKGYFDHHGRGHTPDRER